MSTLCSWVGCGAVAKHHKVALDGESWANLCDDHEQEWQRTIAVFDPRKLLAGWIKAQGGPKRAAQRMR